MSFDRSTVLRLLNPESKDVFRTEEERRPWRPAFSQSYNEPFLRLWDGFSGSQPAGDGHLRSRAKLARLDTKQARKESLSIHADHKRWVSTPYISFTNSPSDITELANYRATRNRGQASLTVIDPNKRLRLGLPILNAKDEMDYYKISDPYNKSMTYYENHFLCLWEVTKDEVVGCWQWNELVTHEDWYRDVVMPALWSSRKVASTDTLLSGFARMSLSTQPSDSPLHSCRTRKPKTPKLTWDFGCRVNNADREEDSTSNLGHVSESDTDDEVEQANASDDLIKILEGDW